MRRIAGDTFMFQQDSAPAHRARETVRFLQRETSVCLSRSVPPNSPNFNPVDYKIWGLMQERVYKTTIEDTVQYLIDA